MNDAWWQARRRQLLGGGDPGPMVVPPPEAAQGPTPPPFGQGLAAYAASAAPAQTGPSPAWFPNAAQEAPPGPRGALGGGAPIPGTPPPRRPRKRPGDGLAALLDEAAAGFRPPAPQPQPQPQPGTTPGGFGEASGFDPTADYGRGPAMPGRSSAMPGTGAVRGSDPGTADFRTSPDLMSWLAARLGWGR